MRGAFLDFASLMLLARHLVTYMMKPIDIMEGALARKLRARPALKKRGLLIEMPVDGVVIRHQDGKVLGIWRWNGSAFCFFGPDDTTAQFEARTLMAASFYTSRIFLD